MRKLWAKFKNFIEKHGVIKVFGPIVILILALVVLPDLVGAEDAPQTAAEAIQETKAKLVAVLVTVFAFLQAMLYPLVLIASALMDNEILLGVEMENKILEIWVEIRNWVNILFVMALVGIAIYNVLGIAGDGSNYALKSILPKIVIGLIAVNFSFLGMKLMIDSVGVITEAVYALPTQFVQWNGQKSDLEVKLCSKYASNLNSQTGEAIEKNYNEYYPTDTKSVKDSTVLGAILCESEGEGEDATLTGKFNDLGNTFFSQFGQHNATAAIMINMGLLNDMDVIDDMINSGDKAVDILSKMALRSLFTIFMFIMFGFAFAALVVVFLARLIILWICLALSPFIVLFFVFPDITNFAGGGELDLKDKFFKHLFVPLVIGVVLSIGFTMLSVLYDNKGESEAWMGALGSKQFSDLENIGSKKVSEMISTVQTTDVSDFQDLLIAVSAVLIIWIGVFSAAEGTVASGITGTIKQAGESVGKFIAKTPLYMTVIPIPGVGGSTDASLASVFKLPAMISQQRENQSSEQAREAGKAVGILEYDLGDKAQDAKTKLGRSTSQSSDAQILNEYLKHKGADTNTGELRGVLESMSNPKLSQEDINTILRDGVVKSSQSGGVLAERVWDPSNVKAETGEWGKTPISRNDKPGSGASSAAPADGTDSTGDTSITVTLQGADGKKLSETPAALTEVGAAIAGNNTAQIGQIFNGTVAPATIAAANALPAGILNTLIGEMPVTGGKLNATAFTQAVTNAATATPGGGGGGGTAPVSPDSGVDPGADPAAVDPADEDDEVEAAAAD